MICFKSLILRLICFYIFTTKCGGFVHPNINDFRIDDSNEILKYSIIKPHIINARSKRSILNTSNENPEHIKDVILTYQYKDENIKMNLHLNENILTGDNFLSVQNLNGTGHIVSQTNEGTKIFCDYQGIIEGKPNSSVAISTCNGNVNGVVFDENNTFFIYSPDHYEKQSYLIQSTDLVRKGKCGVTTSPNHHQTHRVVSDNELSHLKLRHKRSVIKGPYNSNEESLFVELILVFDKSMYKHFKKDIQKVHKYSKELINIINSIYQPLNMFIALVGVVVWTIKDEILISRDSDETLLKFMEYTKTLTSYSHDNAILLTNKKFYSEVVGKAYIGTMCSSASVGVVLRENNIIGVMATTIAHEMGHNFGMKHDEDILFCHCQAKNCIMGKVAKTLPIQHWSTCSKSVVTKLRGYGMYECFRNKPEELLESSSCGNGFVDHGEECDCGLASSCKNKCCNGHTCKLRMNATCATGKCCDLNTCQLKQSGIKCRPVKDDCDLPEYCTGNSEYCPDDVFKQNGYSCDNNQSYCYKGLCGSRNSQCQKIWGQDARSEESCYDFNLIGNTYGHCGANYSLNVYNKCYERDKTCGLLQCTLKSLLSVFQVLAVGAKINVLNSYTQRTFHTNSSGFLKVCYTAEINAGPDAFDVGLTPNGAKCGVNKMCVNQKCVQIENEESNISCLDNCNENGVCNNKGNCYCFDGFAPPFCKDVGKFESYFYILIAIAVLLIVLVAFGMAVNFYKKKTIKNKLIRESTKLYDETTKSLTIGN